MGPSAGFVIASAVLASFYALKLALHDAIDFKTHSVVVEPYANHSSSFAQHFFYCTQQHASAAQCSWEPPAAVAAGSSSSSSSDQELKTQDWQPITWPPLRSCSSCSDCSASSGSGWDQDTHILACCADSSRTATQQAAQNQEAIAHESTDSHSETAATDALGLAEADSRQELADGLEPVMADSQDSAAQGLEPHCFESAQGLEPDGFVQHLIQIQASVMEADSETSQSSAAGHTALQIAMSGTSTHPGPAAATAPHQEDDQEETRADKLAAEGAATAAATSDPSGEHQSSSASTAADASSILQAARQPVMANSLLIEALSAALGTERQANSTKHQFLAEHMDPLQVVVQVASLPPTTFLTLDMLVDTVDSFGVWESVLLLLMCIMLVSALHAGYCRLVEQKLRENPMMFLPLRVRKDPKKLDAFFTLRQAAEHRNMWFRLLGMSGAAVRMALAAEQRSKNMAAKARGAARFAACQLQLQRRRLQQEHKARLSAQKEQLGQQHDAAMLLASQQHQEQEAELQGKIDALSEDLSQQHHMVRQLQSDKDGLLQELRCKADVIAEQRATIGSLGQQLLEVKSDKSHLDQELREVRDQLAKDRGRLEALLHEGNEVKGRAHQVNTKYEVVQSQLSEALSSNAQLKNEVQHLRADAAEAEAAIQELRMHKQQLEDKREQLQEQLAANSSQLSEARSRLTDTSGKLAQSEERGQLLQEQLSAAQASQADLTGQLQKLQGSYAAAESTIAALRDKVAVTDGVVVDSKASLAELQGQLRQLEEKTNSLRVDLAESNNSNVQLRSDMQHLAATHAAAEASIQELRSKKQGLGAKVDELQQRLTASAAELAESRSQHALAAAQLQQQQEAGQGLQQQLAAAVAKAEQQASEAGQLQQSLAAQKAMVEQLSAAKQQLQAESGQQGAQLALQARRIEELSASWQQEQAKSSEALQQVQQLSSENSELLDQCEKLDRMLEESTQLLEEREVQLQELQEAKAVIERRLMEASSSLATKSATLREAQASLSDTEGKLHDEEERNLELEQANVRLQRLLESLEQDRAQLDKDLEEMCASHDRLAEELEQVTASHELVLVESMAMHNKTEDLLAENINSLVELGGKLTAAQAGLAAVTRERDDLAKKLYWAEIARDQHGAAKNLATKDAIEARQALTEEKLLRRQVSCPSPAAALAATGSGGADDVAAQGGGGGAGGNRQLLRQNSSTKCASKTWRTVEASYLKQHFNDKPTASSGSPGPGSANSSPRHDMAEAATATALGGGTSSSRMHSPRSRLSPAASSSAAGVSVLAAGEAEDASSCMDSSSPYMMVQQAVQASQMHVAAVVASDVGAVARASGQDLGNSTEQRTAVGDGNTSSGDLEGVVVSSFVEPARDNGLDALRRSSALSSPQHTVQALRAASDYDDDDGDDDEDEVASAASAATGSTTAASRLRLQGAAEVGAAASADVDASCSTPTADNKVASAAGNLRSNFTVDCVSAAAAAAEDPPVVACEVQQDQDGSQQQASADAVDTAVVAKLPACGIDTPSKVQAPEQGVSPAVKDSASNARTRRQQDGDQGDRSLLPLALSPVPFDLAASTDLTTPLVRAAGAEKSPAGSVSLGSGSVCSSSPQLWDAARTSTEGFTAMASPPPAVAVAVAATAVVVAAEAKEVGGAAGDDDRSTVSGSMPELPGEASLSHLCPDLSNKQKEFVWSPMSTPLSAAAATARRAQQLEQFYTPVPAPVGGPDSPAGAAVGESDEGSMSPEAGSTPFFTPSAVCLPATAAAAGGEIEHDRVGGNRSVGSSRDSRWGLAGRAVSAAAQMVCSMGSLGDAVCSDHVLDDGADVLFGSLSEVDFVQLGLGGDATAVAAVLRQSQHQEEHQATAAGGGHTDTAAKKASSLAVKDCEQSGHACNTPATGDSMSGALLQQQHEPGLQQQKLTRNQKRNVRKRQKKAAERAAATCPDSCSPGCEQQQEQQQVQEQGQEQEQTLVLSAPAAAAEAAVPADDVGVVDDIMEDVPSGASRGMTRDSPSKIRVKLPSSPVKLFQGSGAAGSGSSGTSSRYSTSPMRGAFASPSAAAAAALAVGSPCLSRQAILPDRSSVCDDDGVALVDVGLADRRERLRDRLRVDSPTSTSCSSIKSLVALSRQQQQRDGKARSSAGSDGSGGRVMLSGSPQRFRSKFGVAPPPADGASDAAIKRSLSQPGRGSAGELACCPGAAVDAGVAMFRSSVQWKALSDSVTELSRAAGVPAAHGVRRSCSSPSVSEIAAAAAAAAAEVRDVVSQLPGVDDDLGWTVAENMLYFD